MMVIRIPASDRILMREAAQLILALSLRQEHEQFDLGTA